MDFSWTATTGEVLNNFQVSPKDGLSPEQVALHSERYGTNELPEEPGTPLWKLVLEQFKDQLVLILLGSAVVSFVLALLEDAEDSSPFGAFVEPSVILLILIANAAVGVIQESNAEKAIDALMQYSPDEANVLRSGKVSRIHAVQDLDQAILTGESVSVSKSLDVVSDVKAVKQDMTNMLFSGTTVVNGSARAVVVLTGQNTAIGDIHKSISSQIGEKTPLKRKLDEFGDMLAKVISVICVLVWLINVRHFWDPAHHGALKGAVYYFKIAVALAVAAIPEGLAAVITACLALGTKKMAQKNAIVRNLPSVETLGSTNVICSDKTGTLTTNQMSVSRFAVVDESTGLREFIVGGTTFSPHGSVTSADGKDVSVDLRSEPVQRLAEICVVCNDAKVTYNAERDAYSNVGEPTEAALKVLAEKIGSFNPELSTSLQPLGPSTRASAVSDYLEQKITRLLTFEFSRDRKMMSVLVQLDNTGCLFVKGAPESVLERCTTVLTPGGHKTASYGKDGLRTMALAFVDSAEQYSRFEHDLTFVSLVGMLDPPRPEVRDAVASCKAAGIRVVCITGDNKGTAESVCRSVGIFDSHEDLTGKSYTGREFEDLSHAEKARSLRTEPKHKSLGLVVAMVVPDIGVAMGSGTDVAKLAADMVLADSNFATIEKAQFIRYLISSNIGEVVSIFLTVLLGMPEALIPPLISKWLFFRYMVVGAYVGVATVAGYAWWFMFYENGPQISYYQLTHFHQCSALFPDIGCDMFTGIQARHASTMSLSILVTVEMFNAMNSLSENESLLRLPLWKNMYLVGAITLSMALHFVILYVPFFSAIFAIAPLDWIEWKAVLWLSAPVLLVDEALKLLSRADRGLAKRDSVPGTGLYPSTEIVEPYPRVDVIDLVRVEDGTQLEKTAQDGARAACEEASGVRAACLGDCPGPVEGEGECAAV
ncbi:calcium-transporting ATPase [Lactarius sanguifluus]|nr:calcium-transporting ATPase [Lactarius sanguifluus]